MYIFKKTYRIECPEYSVSTDELVYLEKKGYLFDSNDDEVLNNKSWSMLAIGYTIKGKTEEELKLRGIEFTLIEDSIFSNLIKKFYKHIRN